MSKPVPPAPIGWNKTIQDLLDEMNRGERRSVGSPELDWAREYERNQIPDGIRFPRKGDVYETLDDLEVEYLTSWAAPYTGSGKGTLKKGERIVINSEPTGSRPIGTYASAVDNDAVQKRIVPASECNAPKYRGFYFYFRTVELNQKFKLVFEQG